MAEFNSSNPSLNDPIANLDNVPLHIATLDHPTMAESSSLNPSLNNPIAKLHNDPLHIERSGHPGLVLTDSLLNGVNYLDWSRQIKMALGAKLKLGFIDGSVIKPEATSAEYKRWLRCDYMVTCWILNSMTRELSNYFLSACSSQELWTQIVDRFGSCDS